ncbi:hypothetical protein CEXT_372571 [Caerostris extrusa]|uniref:Tudor domain-containing protein n=1 Tax=Caerostris extrusa TaxID=172846 RepID=A0AAV4VNW9_CAEEX|nr:hypothetical protein CEXT_372571 [Caerostris extrusa]
MMEPKENLMLTHDWDDTELIEAYKKLLLKRDARKAARNKALKKDKKKAVYSEDNLLYEAVILSIYEDSCTVEFLSYGNEEDVNLSTLKRSLGKLAREKQKKSAYYYYQNTKSVTESENEETKPSYSKYSSNRKKQDEGNSTDLTPPTHSHIPCPPLPPIPQDPTFAHNPNLSAMMMAWYIAGYYTGYYTHCLNTSQNHQSFQYNCGHGKQCCQHC